jgi:uroporphyrin-3 C-methyltransferase
LTPSQTYFLRENLKLRLLAAKLALLQRDEVSFRADLVAAKDWNRRFFGGQDEASKAFGASLDEMLLVPVVLHDAQIAASMAAARAARGGH